MPKDSDKTRIPADREWVREEIRRAIITERMRLRERASRFAAGGDSKYGLADVMRIFDV